MSNNTIITSALVSLLFFIGIAQATIVICPDDMTVQQAIDGESEGGEVVLSSSCSEGKEFRVGDGIDVNKRLLLRAASSTDPPVISGNGSSSPVTVSAGGSEVRGIEIRYVGSEPEIPALDVASSDGVTVVNNTISNQGSGGGNYGVRLFSSDGANVTGNNITSSGSGDSNNGLVVEGSGDGHIHGNSVTAYGAAGTCAVAVVKRFGDSESRNNTISNNTVSVHGTGSGNFGIYVGSGGNVFRWNDVSSSGSSSDGAGVLVSPRDACSWTEQARGSNSTFSGNSISTSASGNGNAGLLVEGVSNITFDGNSVQASGGLDTLGAAFVSDEDGTGSDGNLIEGGTISMDSSDGYGVVFTESANNTLRGSEIDSASAPDIGNLGSAGGDFYNFVVDTDFDKQEIEFGADSESRVFVQYHVYFLVTNASDGPLGGVSLSVRDSNDVEDSRNPTANATVWTNSTGVGGALLTEFVADREDGYTYFTNYTAVPSIGLNNTTQVNASSVQTVEIGIEAGAVFAQTALSTTGDVLSVDADSVGATLEIATDGAVSGASLSIASHVQNPESSGALGVAALGKYLQIEASDGISSGMRWAMINISYSDSDLAAANLDESSLRIHHYNGTSGSWQAFDPPSGGVDVAGNVVWANTTHFSTFGVFGSAPVQASVSESSEESGGSGGGGGLARREAREAVVQAAVNDTPAPVTPSEVSAPAQAAEAQDVAPEGPVFSPPQAQAPGNPITGLFALGIDGKSLSGVTGMLVTADGSPSPAAFIGLVSVALAGSVIYMKRELIFRKRENKEYADEGRQAGVAGEAGEGADRDTPEARGGAEGRPEEERKVRGAGEEDRDQV